MRPSKGLPRIQDCKLFYYVCVGKCGTPAPDSSPLRNGAKPWKWMGEITLEARAHFQREKWLRFVRRIDGLGTSL
jgi:hypothetical protein